MERLVGVGASPGIAMGVAHVLAHRVDIHERRIAADQVDAAYGGKAYARRSPAGKRRNTRNIPVPKNAINKPVAHVTGPGNLIKPR